MRNYKQQRKQQCTLQKTTHLDVHNHTHREQTQTRTRMQVSAHARTHIVIDTHTHKLLKIAVYWGNMGTG